MNIVDDTTKEMERVAASRKLIKALLDMKTGETVQLGEYHAIQRLGSKGYIVIGKNKSDEITTICHIPLP